MVVSRFGLSSAIALVVLGAATSADAADYMQPLPPPPPPIFVQPPQQDFADGWYLRGHVGIGMNRDYTLEYQPAPANVGNGFVLEHNSINDAFFVGAGVGYEFNNWLRFEATVDYRAKARVYAFGSYPPDGLDTYEGQLKSWIFLGNAFVDLGTWNCFTPFVGVGVGAAYNSLVDFTDTNPNGGRGFGRNPSEWSLAWALHAGVAYNVSKNFKIELAYRYLNYGSITDTIDCVGGCQADSYKFDDLSSHDIMIGFRWTCCEETPPPPRYVYTPPPVYTLPPLRSKG